MGNARIKKTQFIFREVNQRIAEITLKQDEKESGFLCECGLDDCAETVALSLADYQALRDEGNFFIAAPGHCAEGVDRRVESRESFDVLAQL